MKSIAYLVLGLCWGVSSTLAAAPLLSPRPVPEVIPDSPLFASKSWKPVVVPTVAQPTRVEVKPELPPAPPPPPAAPPLPFSFAGRLLDGEQLQLFLLYNGQTLSAKVGDKLAQQYQLEQITATQAVFIYLPLNIKQTLVFNSNNVGSSRWAAPSVATQSRP